MDICLAFDMWFDPVFASSVKVALCLTLVGALNGKVVKAAFFLPMSPGNATETSVVTKNRSG